MANDANPNVVVECADGIQLELIARERRKPGFTHVITLTDAKKKQMAAAIEKAWLDKSGGK